MLLEQSLFFWEKYGLNFKKTLKILNVSDLIINFGCENYGIKATCKDISEGKTSSNLNPLSVIWIREENKFLLEDGYHRFVKGILNGKKKFLCKIDWTGYTLLWQIPEQKNRFDISKHDITKILLENSTFK